MTTFRDYLLDNSTFRTDFEAGFDYAKSQNIQEFQDFDIKTFDDYLDWCESYVEWIPRENNDGKNVYHHLCTFHCFGLSSLGQVPESHPAKLALDLAFPMDHRLCQGYWEFPGHAGLVDHGVLADVQGQSIVQRGQ